MRTPTADIAALDRDLQKDGQDAILSRIVPNSADLTHAVRAFVRGYKPKDLAGGVAIGTGNAVLSPTGLAGSSFAADLPRATDKITIAGRKRNILGVEPIYLENVLVRLNLTVAG